MPLQAPYVVVHPGEGGRPAAISLTGDAPEGLLTDDTAEAPEDG